MIKSPSDYDYVKPLYRGDRYLKTGKRLSANSLKAKIDKIEAMQEGTPAVQSSSPANNPASDKLQERAAHSNVQCMSDAEKERITKVLGELQNRMNLPPTFLESLLNLSEQEIQNKVRLIDSYTPEYEFVDTDFAWKEEDLNLDQFDQFENTENMDDDDAGWMSSWAKGE